MSSKVGRKPKRPSVQYNGHCDEHGIHVPMRIVLHDTESHDHAGIMDVRGIFDFWDRQGAGYGAHLVIDKHGNTGCGAAGDIILWHVANHNTGSIGIEQIGFARFSLRSWLARPRQLRKVAQWLAWYSYYWEIPLVHSTVHGVCTHADFHGGHTDPGKGYPLKRVIKMAQKIRAKARDGRV